VPQELHDLPTHLKLTKITMEVDTIQALQIQLHMPIEHIVDRHLVDPSQT
jgi:hypothetical protein